MQYKSVLLYGGQTDNSMKDKLSFTQQSSALYPVQFIPSPECQHQ